MQQAQSPRRASRRRARLWTLAETVAWATGITCLVAAGARYVHGTTASQQGIAMFAELQASALDEGVDLSLWSEARISAWREASKLARSAPLAVLRIPRIQLEVPVLEGADEVTLNQGAGHIPGTALPGADGNSGIAAHRDGFFRGLKDVRVGDLVELETLRGTATYRIDVLSIVGPDDVTVLRPTAHRSLTLVTCFPFYFVGPAPKRSIVRAVALGPDEANGRHSPVE